MGKPMTVLTDRQPNDMEQFVIDSLRDMVSVAEQTDSEIDGIYISVSFENGVIMSNTKGLNPMGTAEVAASAMLDAVDKFAIANLRRWREEAETLEAEGDTDDG